MRRPAFLLLSLMVLGATANTAFPQRHQVTKDELRQTREQEIEIKRRVLQQSRLLKSVEMSAVQGDYDATYYKLNLNIDSDAEQLSGTVEMTAVAKTTGFQSVELDLMSNMIVDVVGGAASSYTRSGNKLTLQLSQPHQPGVSFTVSIQYHGRPQSGGFGAFGFNQHNGEPIIWTLSEPYFARSWWPCKDQPNDKADSVDVIVTVPQNLTLASNGRLLSNVNNGDGTRTFHWSERYPITTYLVSLAITNYEIFSQWFHPSTSLRMKRIALHGERSRTMNDYDEPFFSQAASDSMEVRYYVYPEFLENARSQLTETIDMLTLFHEIFGPYPFLSEKYGIAQFPWPGGMEHQTITSQGGFGVELTVHELAHQWWGDKITNASWGDIWLNEGFASYAEALYFEHTRGRDYYHNYMSFMDWNHPYPIFVDDTTSVWRIFHRTVYDKGAWFLHMLRHVVGDETFFDILLAYSHDPRFEYRNATTAGFQSVCESVAGKDLDWFFQPWIYEAGRPIYRAVWRFSNTAGPILHLTIQQLQTTLFPMPIDITVEFAGGDTVVSVFNDDALQTFDIPVSDEPTNIILDKDGWILKTIDSVISSEDSSSPLPSQFALHPNYPNPFNAGTSISFSLPQRSEVLIRIYTLTGREVRTLVQQSYTAGTHRVSWNGLDDAGEPAASGLYFYQMRAGDFTQSRKMLLIR